MNPILKFKEENELSYRDLAIRCKVDTSTLAKLAKNQIDIKNITFGTVLKICDTIGIDNPRDFLDGF